MTQKKAGTVVGTKKAGTKVVGTKKARHSSWPSNFTPKAYYKRSKNSTTGFRGVSIENDNIKNRTSTYRVKIGNSTIVRTDDLHDACEAYYEEDQKRKKVKEEEKANDKNRSKLDDLDFETGDE